MNKRVRVIISGFVQGVFFRARTRDEAISRGVTGWVTNRPDGKVEALFEGEDEAVEHMVAWCHHGPPHAGVKSVEVEWEAYKGEFRGFGIKY